MSRFITVKNWHSATVEDIRNWATEYGVVRNMQMQNRMVKVAFENAENAAEAGLLAIKAAIACKAFCLAFMTLVMGSCSSSPMKKHCGCF